MDTIPIETINKELVSNTHEEKHSLAKKLRQKRLKKIILSLLSVSLFFFLTTVFSQFEVYNLKRLEANNELTNSSVPVTPDQIVEAVSKHILLPDTVPRIASIQDAKKLSASQAFFKDAVNGDVVLVYTSTIIIYRPTQDILVAVGDMSATPKE